MMRVSGVSARVMAKDSRRVHPKAVVHRTGVQPGRLSQANGYPSGEESTENAEKSVTTHLCNIGKKTVTGAVA